MSTNSTLSHSASNDPSTLLFSTNQSTGLEHDNECLRAKLRQLREENAHLITTNHTLVGDLESVHYELHRTSGRLQVVEQEATSCRVAAANELSSLRESFERQQLTALKDLEHWQQKVEESTNAVQQSELLVQDLRTELEELGRIRKQVEC